MERVETAFDEVMGALEAHDVARWSAQELRLLLSLITTYHTQRVAQANTHAACTTEAGDSAHSLCDERTAMAVAEVDRGLAQVRRFLLTQPTATAATKNPTHVPYATMENEDDEHKSDDERRCNALAVAHPAPVYCVDAFLYNSEEDIERLVQQGRVAREYCRACGSTDIGLTEFITHSFGQDQLVYLSCFLLPRLLAQSTSCLAPRRDSVIVDVGSRLGVVLWSCYHAAAHGLLPSVGRIVGVELDEEMVQLQQRVQERVCRARRRHGSSSISSTGAPDSSSASEVAVSVVHSDCFNGAGAATLAAADVVILHNVFEFFCDSQEAHLRAWLRLREVVRRPGQLLICCPSLAETFRDFDADVLRRCGFAVDDAADEWCDVAAQDKDNVSQDDKRRATKRAREEDGSTRDAVGSATPHVTVTEWLAAYVEPVSHDALAHEFVAWRQSQCEGEADVAQHACCESEDKSDGEDKDDGELHELVHNMHVYRVR